MKKIFFLIFNFYTIVNIYSQTVNEYLENAYHKEWRESNYTGAINDYDKAILLETSNCSYLYFSRGQLKFKMDDYTGAIDDYTIAIKNDLNCTYSFSDGNLKLTTTACNSSEIYNARGKAKTKLRDYFGAITDFGEAIKFNKNYEEAYYNRGRTKAKLKDYRGAILDFNKAINVNPNYTVIYYDRGNAKFDLKDYEGAILDYTKRIQLYPNSPEEYFNRGLTKIILKQKDSGCLDFSKAGELGYEDAYEMIKKYCN